MIEPSVPLNESARLAALQKMRLLDTPLEERFERITRFVCRLLDVPRASISLVDESRQWFKSIQGSALTETPRTVSFCGHAIMGNEITLVPDAKQDIRFHDNPLVTTPDGIVFYAGQPLKSPDGCNVGVLCAIDTKSHDFSDADMRTLRDLAALAEAELNTTTLIDTQRELLSQLDMERRRALIDPLTRLWNRDGIMEILSREYARALRNHAHLGVLMADIDYFKRVNDTHGHPVGDAALREVAKRLLSSVREYDAIGRIGGDEFLVVMPIVPGNGNVGEIASRVCQHVGETPIVTNEGHLTLTISIGGVDETLDFSCNMEELIKRADDALYRAKQMGRNRTVVVGSASVDFVVSLGNELA
jgi:diguanylate cyclase (GGDEF)-like protein